MDGFAQARREFTPSLTVAALYLCTAASIACVFLRIRDWPLGVNPNRLAEDLAIASPLVFLCACVLVFFRARLGYALGLVAGLIALPWFVWTELSLDWNSWITLNIADEDPIAKELLV
jgi:DMSO/TMAO reductase YedYZ heme-binding membrane subunit